MAKKSQVVIGSPGGRQVDRMHDPLRVDGVIRLAVGCWPFAEHRASSVAAPSQREDKTPNISRRKHYSNAIGWNQSDECE
jgi:hypothetical protein